MKTFMELYKNRFYLNISITNKTFKFLKNTLI